MERSVAFWSGEFGLDVTFSGGSFTFLDGGGTQLVLNEVDALPDDTSQTEIVFEVEDVIATHAEMSDRGVTFEVELRAAEAIAFFCATVKSSATLLFVFAGSSRAAEAIRSRRNSRAVRTRVLRLCSL